MSDVAASISLTCDATARRTSRKLDLVSDFFRIQNSFLDTKPVDQTGHVSLGRSGGSDAIWQ